jgi:hypothetical protein
MRQLTIAAFLFIIALIGSYYLATQRLNLHSYYPDTTVQFPNLMQPRPLPSLTPGPALKKLSGFAQTPEPKATVANTSRYVPHSAPHPVPVKSPSLAAPTAPAVTPMPAPSYQAFTPMPLMHTPPPIVAPSYPTIGQPAASPSPSTSPHT